MRSLKNIHTNVSFEMILFFNGEALFVVCLSWKKKIIQ